MPLYHFCGQENALGSEIYVSYIPEYFGQSENPDCQHVFFCNMWCSWRTWVRVMLSYQKSHGTSYRGTWWHYCVWTCTSVSFLFYIVELHDFFQFTLLISHYTTEQFANSRAHPFIPDLTHIKGWDTLGVMTACTHSWSNSYQRLGYTWCNDWLYRYHRLVNPDLWWLV